jgi:5-oxoprolinase (ATP-hydrolysing)
MNDQAGWEFWIDRGGTFTDVLGRGPDGIIRTQKLLSASTKYDDAGVEAMRRLLVVQAGAPFPADQVKAIKMGTTVATNALLERKGAKTLFVTTKGFADALRIGDQSRPDLFVLNIVRPEPLYAGVLEADERLDAKGGLVRPLDQAALAEGLAKAVADGFAACAIALLHADLNPAHEALAARLAKDAGFDFVATSHEVSPLPRFLPRAETTVVDAYLTPALRTYVDRMARAVEGAPLWFMTSGGDLVAASAFRGRDAITSGPAGGAVGVARTADAAGAKAVLGFDMGGTSTDVCRYAGALERKDEARLAGVRVRAPMLDVETVAAGGGSILTFDGLRARVGPDSAGADPGPACYGKGGPATLTDANLVLGRLDPARFPSIFGPAGDQKLDAAASFAALERLAQAMGALNVQAAAEGFVAIAVEQTVQAIRRISTERGFDPRGHSLVAFGGAAGQIACWVADALGATDVLCPRYASLLSAWGIGQAQVTALRQAGVERPLDADGLARFEELSEILSRQVADDILAQGEWSCLGRIRPMLRYQGSDAVIPIEGVDHRKDLLTELRAGFEKAHQRLFGFIEPDRQIIIASVEVEVTAPGVDLESAKNDNGLAEIEPAKILTSGRLLVRDDTQIAMAEGWTATTEADGLIRLTRTTPLVVGKTETATSPDPITLELFNRRFMGVAEAMGAALERTAQSVNIKERLDFSCALFDTDGGLVANAPHMPVHLGSMGASVRAVRDRHPVLQPGEAYGLNNPYAGGTHLPDITVVMPVFVGTGAEPDFYVAARGHHADFGGVQPGSMPPFSKTIAEEGVLLDALPIMRNGVFLDADVRAALGSGPWPARAPDRNVADLKAQIAACQAGAAAVTAMIEAHGGDVVARYMGFVQANAEASVRRAIASLKNGAARIPMDGGGEIVVSIKVFESAGEAIIDFTGSSATLASNFNAPAAVVDAAVLYVFRTLIDDDIPLNSGCLAPLTIIVPSNSMLNPTPPAAVVAGNVETSQHIVDALYSALGVAANSQGSMNNFTFGGPTGEYYETISGGTGAVGVGDIALWDGASAVQSHMTNSRLTDPEILERRFPVRVEAFSIRRGSGGPGAKRGGDGAIRRLMFLAPMQTALLSTRRYHAPQGICGGGPALAGRQRLIRASGEVMELPGCFSLDLSPGEAIEIETPGGGGFGHAE